MNFKTKPFNHQIEAFETLKDLNWKAIFFEMGTGKTKLIIDVLRYKCFKKDKVLRTLIVAPKVALMNWYRELDKHSSLQPYAIILEGTAKQRREKLLRHDKEIFIINYEGIGTLLPQLTKQNWGMIIADESQRIKNHKSKRTKHMLLLSKLATSRFILSGTPIANSPEDIFSQALFLDYGGIFGSNFFAFRNKFFIDENVKLSRFIPREKYFPKYVLDPNMEPEYKLKMAELALIKSKKECLDLPPVVYETLEVEMSPEQKKVYKAIEQDLIALFDQGEAVVAANAAVAQIRLRQITSGFTVIDRTLVPGRKPNEPALVSKYFDKQPKLEALKTLLADLTPNHKVIIWACFRANIFMLLKELKRFNPACIFGDTKDKTAQEDKFNFDDSCRIIIANPASAGIAINLVAASYACYYSQNFVPEHREQSEPRCHRSGSEIHEKITYIDLLCKGTVDEIILEALRKKENLSSNILEIAKRIRERREVR